MARKTPIDQHCHGCGRDTQESREPIVQIKVGSYVLNKAKQRVFQPSSNYGEMHESCFLLAIGDPQGVEKMAEVATV